MVHPLDRCEIAGPGGAHRDGPARGHQLAGQQAAELEVVPGVHASTVTRPGYAAVSGARRVGCPVRTSPSLRRTLWP